MIMVDICEYLQSQKPEMFTIGENVFVGIIDDTPDNQVCIAPTGGFPQTLQLDDNKYTFQIRVRDKSHNSCYNKVVTIYNLLDDGKTREIIAPKGRQMIITALQPPFLLNKDEQGRVNYVFNIAVLTKRE